MSKPVIPMSIADTSSFARALAAQLAEAGSVPGHVQLMNMLARAGGYRNFQHLKAKTGVSEPSEPVDTKLIQRCLAQYDDAGCMMRWPAKRAVQDQCLWGFWAQLPARESLSEAAVNTALNAAHAFGDPAILRRTLVTQGFMTREIDGSNYCRVERVPPATARALIGQLALRWKGEAL